MPKLWLDIEVEIMGLLDLFTSAIEKYNLSLNSLAYAVVLLYAIGIIDLGSYQLSGIPLPFFAAIYALSIFILDKVGSTVYPRLHPDTGCERCSSKKLRIINATIKCQKCEYVHRIGAPNKH